MRARTGSEQEQVAGPGEYTHPLEARGLAYVARAAVCRMQPQHAGLGPQVEMLHKGSLQRALGLPAEGGGHGRTPAAVFRTGGAAPSKTPLFSGQFRGAIAVLRRASNSSSRSAATRTAFLAQARLAISLSRPPESVDRHMSGYLSSGTTRPKRRRSENNTQSAPSRRQARGAPGSAWESCAAA